MSSDSMPPPPPPPPPPPAPAPTDWLEAEWQRVLTASQQPLDAGLPPDVLASPSHIQHAPDTPIRWWRPGWRDGWQYVGWRWIFLTPAALLVLFLIPGLGWPRLLSPFTVLGIKLLLFMAGVALSLVGYVIRRAARARREPFCIFCGYNLSGLPDDYRCPECGRPYTWRLIGEYRRDPQWFIERYEAFRRLPAADLPFAAGAVRRRRRDGT